MAKGKYGQVLDELNRDNEQKPTNKCMYQGCPMKASHFTANGKGCVFHHTSDYHGEVTQAINNNMNHIKLYNKLKRVSNDNWKKAIQPLMNIPELSAICLTGAGYFLKVYLNWIDEKIANEASQLVKETYEMFD